MAYRNQKWLKGKRNSFKLTSSPLQQWRGTCLHPPTIPRQHWLKHKVFTLYHDLQLPLLFVWSQQSRYSLLNVSRLSDGSSVRRKRCNKCASLPFHFGWPSETSMSSKFFRECSLEISRRPFSTSNSLLICLKWGFCRFLALSSRAWTCPSYSSQTVVCWLTISAWPMGIFRMDLQSYSTDREKEGRVYTKYCAFPFFCSFLTDF